MSRRVTKLCVLGLTVALVAGIPLPARAADVHGADAAIAVAEEKNLVDVNGLVKLNDGNWYYMENGQLSDRTNGTLQPAGDDWMYVGQYRVDTTYTGFCENEAGNWYVRDGEVQFSYTGVMDEYNNGKYQCYYVTDGRVDTDVNGLRYVAEDGNWYLFQDGKLSSASRTLAEYNGSWWYIGSGSKVDFSYTGACENEAGTWYVKNGQVDFGYNGVLEGVDTRYGNRPYKYYFVNGKTDDTIHGVYQTFVNGVPGWYGFYKGELATTVWDGSANILPNEYGWWYVDGSTGQVNFNRNGLAYLKGEDGIWHQWYMRGGQIDFSYQGLYQNGSSTGENRYWIVNGCVDEQCTGVYYLNLGDRSGWYGFVEGQGISYTILPNPDNGTWWHVDTKGQIDFSYSGIDRFRNHAYETGEYSWYVRNGQVDFGFSGIVNGYETGMYALVQDGRVMKEVNGIAWLNINGEQAWWQVTKGWVDTSYDPNDRGTLEFYDGSWWYVKNHKVDFSYTGFVEYAGATWYVRDGRYSYETTGFVMPDMDGSYYVTNGRFDRQYCDVVYDRINGEDAWWLVQNGRCSNRRNGGTDAAPEQYGANGNGLWACRNGKVDFDLSGTFEQTESYAVEENQAVQIHYEYQVSGGKVTGVQASVL